MTKNEKIFKRLKKRYSFLFQSDILQQAIQNSFNKNGSLLAFAIGLLENRLDNKQVFNLISINKDEWIDLFSKLYQDTKINDIFQKLQINPVIPIDQITQTFTCFDKFIDELIMLLKQHQINLNISEIKLKSMIRNTFGYLLYNSIDWIIPYHLNEILIDNEYDAKYVVILNNTKLFAVVKQEIVSNCGEKINDLIAFLLGINKPLSKSI